jgi:hypothetical protein
MAKNKHKFVSEKDGKQVEVPVSKASFNEKMVWTALVVIAFIAYYVWSHK